MADAGGLAERLDRLAGFQVFCATRPEDVPRSCARFFSVDGSVPGYTVRWDHHVTGEATNLDAMPDQIDTTGFDGVGTTVPDVDALASVIVVLLGGKASVPGAALEVLRSASHWCDQLREHPDLSREANRLGKGLSAAIGAELRAASRERRAEVFAAQCWKVAFGIARGEPLPFAEDDANLESALSALVSEGRVTRHGELGVIDLRGAPSVDPRAVYEAFGFRVCVRVADHPSGGVRYTVGANPLEDCPVDLEPALLALSRAEHQAGPSHARRLPGPDPDDWGGRRTVLGSPWNHGSRLAPDEVVRTVAAALGLPPVA